MALNLTLSGRLHEIIRQTSIRTIHEAIVELVTNADDAYRSISQISKDIRMEIVRKSNGKTSLFVVDQATGMSLDEMNSNLLTVGNYTATEFSRGMMGRGAKDCSFLGNITFTCIKDNKLNQLVIYQNRTADFLQKEVEVSDDFRSKYQISNNGCNVELELDNSLVPSVDKLSVTISNNIYLRKLLKEVSTTVLLKEGNFNQRLSYTEPSRKLVVSCEYDIPEYNTSAKLEIYRSDDELPYNPISDQIPYGILVSSDKSVYECSALYHVHSGVQDYMWNPNIKYITGSLTCNDIDKIARDATNGNINSKNPYLLIDPNRRNGLVKDHPFTIALYHHAYQLLDIVISRIQDTRDDKLMESGNASDVFNSLNDLISSLLPPESILYTWRTKDDHEKLKEIANTVKNVTLDSNFLGLTWEEIQKIAQDKYLQVTKTSVYGNSFKISFSNDPKLKVPYQILYLPGKISMKINANDHSIRPYISVDKNVVNLTNPGKALTTIGLLVIEATNNMIVRRNVLSGKTSALDISALNEYIYHVNDARESVAPNVFSRILTGIQSIKAPENTDRKSFSIEDN
jgi:hypothetical protein